MPVISHPTSAPAPLSPLACDASPPPAADVPLSEVCGRWATELLVAGPLDTVRVGLGAQAILAARPASAPLSGVGSNGSQPMPEKSILDARLAEIEPGQIKLHGCGDSG